MAIACAVDDGARVGRRGYGEAEAWCAGAAALRASARNGRSQERCGRRHGGRCAEQVRVGGLVFVGYAGVVGEVCGQGVVGRREVWRAVEGGVPEEGLVSAVR